MSLCMFVHIYIYIYIYFFNNILHLYFPCVTLCQNKETALTRKEKLST